MFHSRLLTISEEWTAGLGRRGGFWTWTRWTLSELKVSRRISSLDDEEGETRVTTVAATGRALRTGTASDSDSDSEEDEGEDEDLEGTGAAFFIVVVVTVSSSSSWSGSSRAIWSVTSNSLGPVLWRMGSGRSLTGRMISTGWGTDSSWTGGGDETTVTVELLCSTNGTAVPETRAKNC